MVTWQEIGTDSFRAGHEALDGKRYRSSVSRFYYAAFSLLTYELARNGVVFRHGRGRQTLSHVEMTELITLNLTQFSEARRSAIALLAVRLYRLRLEADYLDQRLDRRAGNARCGENFSLFWSRSMTTVATKRDHTAQEIVERVQGRLTPYQPATVLEVLPNFVNNSGHWWYVVVPPSESIKTALDHDRRVEKTERDLYKMDKLRVSILPVVPDWMDTHK